MILLFCLITLAVPVVIPSLRLFYFAPFLIKASYAKKQSQTLWMALLCGLSMDLFSSGTRIGFLALTFLLATLFVCQLKRYFFKDRLSTLPVMTFLFSAALSILQMSLNLIFQRDMVSLAFSWNWVWWNVLVMPACDGLFAFAICAAEAVMSMFKRYPYPV